jgi:hypothetical protein
MEENTQIPDRAAPLPEGVAENTASAGAKGLEVASPVDLARLTAGWVLLEAVNLGEINPAMARRFSERMDQIFTAAVRGAQIGWGQRGELQIKWPNQFIPGAETTRGERAQRLADKLASSTAISS